MTKGPPQVKVPQSKVDEAVRLVGENGNTTIDDYAVLAGISRSYACVILKKAHEDSKLSRTRPRVGFGEGPKPFVYSSVTVTSSDPDDDDADEVPEFTGTEQVSVDAQAKKKKRKSPKHVNRVSKRANKVRDYILARKTGTYTFTCSTLARHLRVSSETVRKVAIQLEGEGLIQRDGHRDKNIVFRLVAIMPTAESAPAPTASAPSVLGVAASISELMARKTALEQEREDIEAALESVNAELQQARALLF